MTDSPSPLLEEADVLYGLPLGDFTPARDARAKALTSEDAKLAKAVKALRKPSLAAWVVNLLVRRDTGQVEQVLQVGALLREAQESMSGEELRALTRQRRQLTAAVTTRARGLAREEGVRVTEAVAEQVEATLTAGMVDQACGQALRSGLLVTTLASTGLADSEVAASVACPEALGFEAAPREMPEPARPDLHVVPDPDADAKALGAARADLDEAQEQLDEATTTHGETTAALAELEARGMQLQSEIDELRRRIAELDEESEELDEQIADAEEAVDDAATVVTGATSSRDEAAAVLARLE